MILGTIHRCLMLWRRLVGIGLLIVILMLWIKLIVGCNG